MEEYIYNPLGVCSNKIIFNIAGDKVIDVKVIGGCPGNSLGIRELCKNQDIDYIINKLKGIKCGCKNTSCPDQLAQGLISYKEKRDI